MKVNVSTTPDGQSTILTLELPRSEFAKTLDRWTWDEMKLQFTSGREKFDVTFPKLQELRDVKPQLGR